jgi:hypothetical protein
VCETVVAADDEPHDYHYERRVVLPLEYVSSAEQQMNDELCAALRSGDW